MKQTTDHYNETQLKSQYKEARATRRDKSKYVSQIA